MRSFILALCFLGVFAAQPASARPSSMQVPRAAPEWIISEWLNGEPTSLRDLRGKVVVVDFFQLWCPGCNAFSIPLLKRWEQVFAGPIAAGTLQIVSIHTVFEGHDYQNPDKLKNFLKRKKIRHLVGIDRHAPGERVPQTMRLFGTMGTPEMAFIDHTGTVRFQEFGGFAVERAETLLRRLLKEAQTAPRKQLGETR